jgi:hypothetical protein
MERTDYLLYICNTHTVLHAGERVEVEQVGAARLAVAGVAHAVALLALSRAAVDEHARCTETYVRTAERARE